MALDRVRRVLPVLGALLLVGTALVLAGIVPLPLPSPGEYERTTVAVADENGTRLGQVEVRIADTFSKKYTGLSNTSSLGPDEGMLFVYEEEADRTFVMRDMSFPIDIVFVGANRSITAIHHAPVPPSGTTEAELTRYRGRAKWVLEVNRNWTVEHGVTVGDRLVVES